MGEPTDQSALVRAAQAGDQAAFAEIVRIHQRGVYRVAWGLVRNAADADDVAQETFVRAFQALGRFRVGEPLFPWLARIAVNQAYSLHRRRRRRPETPLEPLEQAGQQWAVDDDPADHAADRERGRHVGEALEKLSEEHRTVLVLRAVEGMTYEEIAQTLNVPPGTVMSRLSRARVALRDRLRARTGEER